MSLIIMGDSAVESIGQSKKRILHGVGLGLSGRPFKMNDEW